MNSRNCQVSVLWLTQEQQVLIKVKIRKNHEKTKKLKNSATEKKCPGPVLGAVLKKVWNTFCTIHNFAN